MKKLIKILLICALMLLASAVTVSAETEGYYTYTVSNGEATITDVKTSISGDIIIPSTLGGYPVTIIGSKAFFDCNMSRIEIPDSITTIGYGAFNNCTELRSIVIGSGVTTIGNSAFWSCYKLTKVYISDLSVWCSIDFVDYTSNPLYYRDGLYYTKSLYVNDELVTNLIIPDDVTEIKKYAFYNCNRLTSIEIPNSVTTIGEAAFDSCDSLTSVYYRGNSTLWSYISIGTNNSNLTSANRIYNAVTIKAYDINNEVLIDKYVESSQTMYKSLFPDKNGYTRTIYTDNTFTEIIDANTYITEDIEVYVEYAINQYTYKFVDCDGSVIKEVTADCHTVIEKPENPIREADAKCSSYTFSKWQGYTDGMVLTEDITFTAVYDTTYNHHIELVGTSVTVGDNFTEKVSMVTLKPVNYLICEIGYPDFLELNSITPIDFKYALKGSLKAKDGYNYLTVICQYEDDDATVPQNTAINPFNLSFTVSKTAKPQEVEIEFGEDTYLSGEEDYQFENKINAKFEILPKLASSITIYGESTIYAPTQFNAEVYPDYTTDKTIEWSVDDETVATISRDGVLTPVKNGEVTITATAVGGAYKTKSVKVYRSAYVDDFKSDVGMWDKNVLPDTKEYTIYVTEDTETISITPIFTTGTLTYDNAVVMKNRPKEFELTENETTITLTRVNSGYETCTYTIKVVKKEGLKNETIQANSFKDDCINLLVYDKKVKQIEEAEDVTITVPEKTNKYKVLYWESLANLKPVYEPIIKEL